MFISHTYTRQRLFSLQNNQIKIMHSSCALASSKGGGDRGRDRSSRDRPSSREDRRRGRVALMDEI